MSLKAVQIPLILLAIVFEKISGPSSSGPSTHDPKIQATRNTSYLTASKSLNGRKIARMARILTIFGPNESSRRDLCFENFSNERNERKDFKKILEKFSKKIRKIINYFSYSGGV